MRKLLEAPTLFRREFKSRLENPWPKWAVRKLHLYEEELKLTASFSADVIVGRDPKKVWCCISGTLKSVHAHQLASLYGIWFCFVAISGGVVNDLTWWLRAWRGNRRGRREQIGLETAATIDSMVKMSAQ